MGDLAARRREMLLEVAGEVGQVSLPGPVTNPYVAGNPVEGFPPVPTKGVFSGGKRIP